jgi:hypothetical protein
MSEMIERVSKVIASNKGRTESEIALAILKSLREPTRQMILGGVTLEPTRNSDMVKFIYQGMIDTALK